MRELESIRPLSNRSEVIRTILFILICCFMLVLPTYAATPQWHEKGGEENPQGDQRTTGKTEKNADVPVYGAIGNLDDNYAMDIDGDGNADITLPEADLIEVTVTPYVLVNVYRKEPGSGGDGDSVSTSARGVVKNENAHNKIKVELAKLEPRNEEARAVKITEQLDSAPADNLSLKVYSEDARGNAFTRINGGISDQVLSLTNITQEPPVPITLGFLQPKLGEPGEASSGTYQFAADCRGAFIDHYEDKTLSYEAIYRFSIDR